MILINSEIEGSSDANEVGVDFLPEYNLDQKVKNFVRDVTKSPNKKIRKTTEMLVIPESFRPDTIYQINI